MTAQGLQVAAVLGVCLAFFIWGAAPTLVAAMRGAKLGRVCTGVLPLPYAWLVPGNSRRLLLLCRCSAWSKLEMFRHTSFMPTIMSCRLAAKGEVVGYAITYLRCRCLATPAILAIFVAIGSFRGHRDTV